MPRVTLDFDALTMEEVRKQVLEFLGTLDEPQSEKLAGKPSGAPRLPSWSEFVRNSTDNHKRILETLVKHGGSVNIRVLAGETDLQGPALAGSIASLNGRAKRYFGQNVIQQQTWFRDANGVWTRDYTLEPEIYQHTDESKSVNL